ncbi:hypothetical protein IFM89_012096 [Coptis chinensis]|uniref:VQ domain-containing protein n=1 Tax=Coptis chinensis TaxID=261450 RepID=A0A835I2R0_9MAGN|nr:hypothetical protein IFM89_012096 [Coptis chinensis]
MDKLRVQPHHPKLKRQSTKVKAKPMKIVYISNPMMFKANNCMEFRQIVQELTGQYSNIDSIPSAMTNVGAVNKISSYVAPKMVPKATLIDESVDYELPSVSSSAESADDYFSMEMLENFDGLQYPFIDM